MVFIGSQSSGPSVRGPGHIVVSRRLGISRAVGWPLRFCERDSRFVSKPALR